MNPTPPTASVAPEDRVFLVLLVLVTLAFGWIVQPFFGAVLWAVILAIMFAPLYRRLLPPLRQRRTLAAIATVISVLVIVILPLTLVTTALVQEGAGLYQRIHGLSFGPPDPDLGQARVATGADGTLVGIRKPLAPHEQPIVRTSSQSTTFNKP